MNVTTNTLRVIVVFPAAGKPFQDDDASRQETVGELEARVLTAFGLSEGPIGDNQIAEYTLFDGKDELNDPSTTLGELACDRPVLRLKLSQQIVQGI